MALERIASVELSQAANQLSYIDLHSFLEELLIVIAPALREREITHAWKVDRPLPAVWADRQSLMQVFLNLVKNSERAMEPLIADEQHTLTIATVPHALATFGGARVQIRVADTGTGVRHPELLFKPFQHQATATGLGLYLSRALMRSFSGELHYEPPANPPGELSSVGACFIVELAARPEVPQEALATAPVAAMDQSGEQGTPKQTPGPAHCGLELADSGS